MLGSFLGERTLTILVVIVLISSLVSTLFVNGISTDVDTIEMSHDNIERDTDSREIGLKTRISSGSIKIYEDLEKRDRFVDVFSTQDYRPLEADVIEQGGGLHLVFSDGSSRKIKSYYTVKEDGAWKRPVRIGGDEPEIDSHGDIIYVLTSGKNSGLSLKKISDYDENFIHLKTPDCNSISYDFSVDDEGIHLYFRGGKYLPSSGEIEDIALRYLHRPSGAAWEEVETVRRPDGTIRDIEVSDGTVRWKEEKSRCYVLYKGGRTDQGWDVDSLGKENKKKESRRFLSKEELETPRDKKEWTFVGYVDADNNLDSYGTEDVNEMEEIGSDSNINIIALLDGQNSGDTHCYEVQQDNDTSTITSPEIPLSDINSTWGNELNMGDPYTAIDLAKYVYENYPAEHYLLDMWNHGGSWDWGMCSDDTDGDHLESREVRKFYEVLREDTGKRLLWDVAGYDECLMADYSLEYDEKPYIDYICNSEDSIGGDGWEYDMVLQHMKSDPTLHPEEMAFWIYREYRNYYGSSGTYTTMSVINATQLDYRLTPAVNNLGQKLRHSTVDYSSEIDTAISNAASWQGYDHQRDLVSLCHQLQNEITQSMDPEIYNATQKVIDLAQPNPSDSYPTDPGWESRKPILIHNSNTGENGIKVFAGSTWDSLYNEMMFDKETNWGNFKKALENGNQYPNEEPTCSITSPAEDGDVVVNTTTQIEGTASDGLDSGTVERVEVKIDKQFWHNASGTDSWSYSWDTSGLKLGKHTVMARAYDGTDYSMIWDRVNVSVVMMSSDGRISIQRDEYQGEAKVNLTVLDEDINGSGSVDIDVLSDTEPSGETITLSETSLAGRFEGQVNISLTDSSNVLHVSHGDTITSYYNETDNGTGNPETNTDTATVDASPPGPRGNLEVDWYGVHKTTLMSEGFESGLPSDWSHGAWDYQGGYANDSWAVGQPSGTGAPSPHGGTNVASTNVAGDHNNAEGSYLESSEVTLPTSFKSATLSFWLYTDIESTYDGLNMKMSVNGGTYQNISGSLGYDGPVSESTSYHNPLDNEPGWYGSHAWTNVSVDLSSYNGDTLRFRWHFGSDSMITNYGPAIDDVLVCYGESGFTDHNRVNWTLSPDDGAGENDVAKYKIYRADNSAGPWDSSAYIDSVPAGTSIYRDKNRGQYDGTTWWYVIRAVDDIGNLDNNTDSVPEPTSTNQPPVAPSDPVPTDGATGLSTNVTLTVNVSDPDGDLMNVTFYDGSDDSQIGKNIDVANGTTSVTWSGLSNGTMYNWYAEADDGNLSTGSSVWSFTTLSNGNNAPSSPYNPVPSDGATGVSTDPSLTVNVSDPDGDSMNVTFYDASDDSEIGNNTGITNGTTSVTWSGLTSGTTYNWYAEADDGNLSSTSSSWSITTLSSGNNAPLVPYNPLPTDGATGVSTDPSLTVNVSDPDGDSMTVSFYDASDDSLIVSNSGVTNGTTSVTWSGLSGGMTYSWYAEADDGSLSSTSLTWSFTTENTPPDSPYEPVPNNGSSGHAKDVTLNVTVSDPDGQSLNVTFYDASDDSPIGADNNVATGDVASVNWTGLSFNTTYRWYAVANDSYAENTSETWNFTTNVLPDAPTGPVPEDGTSIDTLSTDLQVNVSDPDNDELNVTFYDASDDSQIGYEAGVTDGDASVTWSGLDTGTTYNWYAVANDSYGETTSSEWSFTTFFNDPPAEPVDPTPANESIGEEMSPELEVNVSDPDGDNMTVEFYDASDHTIIGTNTDVSNGTTSITWNGLSEGTTYRWYAKADDGYNTTRSAVWHFKTNTAPEEPENPSPGDSATGVALSPELSVDVTDMDDDPLTVTFYNADNDAEIDTESAVSNGSTASVTWSDLSQDTEYSWYVEVSDGRLDETSSTWTFTTVANQEPEVTSQSPEDGSTDVGWSPSLSVDVTDPDGDSMTVTFYNASNDEELDSVTDVSNGSTASVTWSDLSPDTTYEWYVEVSDGQVTITSATWSFTTETLQRGVSVTAPSDEEVSEKDTHTYTFTIENTGDAEDTFDISVDTDSSDMTVNIDKEEVTIEAGESRDVQVEVTMPDGVSDGDSTTVTLEAVSQNDSGATASGSMEVAYEPETVPEFPVGAILPVIATIVVFVTFTVYRRRKEE